MKPDKKKKGILSGFSKFQDEIYESYESLEDTPSDYGSPKKAKTTSKKLRRGRVNEESDDEEANTPLLSRHSEELPRRSFLGTKRLFSKSQVDIPETLSKALPPVPPVSLNFSPYNIDQQQGTVNTPSSKKPISKATRKALRKYNISNPQPILQNPNNGPDATVLSDFHGVRLPPDPPEPRLSTISAAHQSRVAPGPMQHVAMEKVSTPKGKVATEEVSTATEEASTPRGKRDNKNDKSSRPSPLQRSKLAFMKAGRALADRLSSSGDSNPSPEKKMLPRMKNLFSHRKEKERFSPDPITPLDYVSSSRRLHPTVVEVEENMNSSTNANEDSYGYDTGLEANMVSPTNANEVKSSYDTGLEANIISPTNANVNYGYAIGFEENMISPTKVNEDDYSYDIRPISLISSVKDNEGNWPLSHHNELQDLLIDHSSATFPASRPKGSITGCNHPSTFSDKIPGLEQHPDVMFFASPPTSSTKRKSVNEDLRYELEHDQKRSKKTSLNVDVMDEDTGLVTDIARLGTGDDHILTQTDANIMYAASDSDETISAGPSRGMRVFGTKKGKEPMPRVPPIIGQHGR